MTNERVLSMGIFTVLNFSTRRAVLSMGLNAVWPLLPGAYVERMGPYPPLRGRQILMAVQ